MAPSLFGLRPQRISSPYLLCSHQNIHISYFSLRHILGTIVSFVFLLFLETSIVWKLELVFGEWRFGYIKICRLYPGSPLMTLHQYHLGGCEKYQYTYISIRTTWIPDLVVISCLQLFSHNQISLVSRSHLTICTSPQKNSSGFSSIERQDDSFKQILLVSCSYLTICLSLCEIKIISLFQNFSCIQTYQCNCCPQI